MRRRERGRCEMHEIGGGGVKGICVHRRREGLERRISKRGMRKWKKGRVWSTKCSQHSRRMRGGEVNVNRELCQQTRLLPGLQLGRKGTKSQPWFNAHSKGRTTR